MREEKKYEILPGVEIPDIKKIQEAASDFSISEVGDVEIKTVTFQPIIQAQASGVSSAELSQLKQLGDKVAEDEAKAKAESRAKMDKIMNKAVQAPESIGDLKASHIAQLNEEKRKALEEDMKAAEEKQAEEDAKNKAREERRKLQQRLLEESREKAAKEKAEREESERAEAEKTQSDDVPSENDAQAVASATPVGTVNAEATATEASVEEPSVQAETPEVENEVPVDNAEIPVEKDNDSAEPKAAPVEKKPEAPSPKDAEPVVKKTAKVVSNEEAFDDFREFLGEDE